MSKYHKILGVDKNASKSEIKKAFRKLAHMYHPDKYDGSSNKFKEIKQAYDIIKDGNWVEPKMSYTYTTNTSSAYQYTSAYRKAKNNVESELEKFKSKIWFIIYIGKYSNPRLYFAIVGMISFAIAKFFNIQHLVLYILLFFVFYNLTITFIFLLKKLRLIKKHHI